VAKIVRGADSAAAAIWRSVISGLFKEARISPPSESVSRKVIDIWAAVISQHIGELAEGESINRLLAIVNAQAEDEGLWFVAHDAPTSYIQQELRRLHAEIESEATEFLRRIEVDRVAS